MKLRIVSGTLARRYITIPATLGSFRPTLERCRESVFSSLGPRLGGADVLDLCAGSGAAGFEMLSRGAARATFVESDKRRIGLIAQHAELFKVTDLVSTRALTAQAFVHSTAQKYDIIYYDPPYRTPELKALVPPLIQILSAGGVLVYERASNDPLEPEIALSSRRYGDTTVDFIYPAPLTSPEKG